MTPKGDFAPMYQKKTYQSELQKCYYFHFLRKPETRNNILSYKIERNATLVEGFK